MLYLIIFLGLFFIGLGTILNVNNAKYLLSGYNTMTEEERKQVDIQAYVPFFKKFHYQLGGVFLFMGAAILHFYGEKTASLFVVSFPILAYIYFISASMQFSHGNYKSLNKIAVVILIATLIFVWVLFYKVGL